MLLFLDCGPKCEWKNLRENELSCKDIISEKDIMNCVTMMTEILWVRIAQSVTLKYKLNPHCFSFHFVIYLIIFSSLILFILSFFFVCLFVYFHWLDLPLIFVCFFLFCPLVSKSHILIFTSTWLVYPLNRDH